MQSLITTETLLHPDLLLTGTFILVFIVTAVYSAAVPQGDRRWWMLGGVMIWLVIAGTQATAAPARLVLLNLAALLVVGMVWVQPGSQAKDAARIYLVMMVAGMLCVGLGLYLTGALGIGPAVQSELPAPTGGITRWAAALLIVGYALKLALVPLYFWLPRIAGSSSPMTTALVVGTLDMAELGELLTLRQSVPWVFTQHYGIWLALALLSMLGGALLALAQRDLKRMLAFSTIDDMGYLVLGVLAGTPTGLTGALLGMVSHALFKTLLFGAVGMAEKSLGEPLTLDCRGLASRFPVSSAMFITGALGMLGIPPLVGFAGRFRLYLAGYQTGGLVLVIAMAAATGLALLYYVRAIHKVWLGRGPGAPDRSIEPLPARVALIALAVVALALGLFPGLLTGLI